MASVLSRPAVPENLRVHLRLGVDLLQAPVLFLEFLQAPHARYIHAAILRAPVVEACVAEAICPAQLRQWYTRLGFLQDLENLAF